MNRLVPHQVAAHCICGWTQSVSTHLAVDIFSCPPKHNAIRYQDTGHTTWMTHWAGAVSTSPQAACIRDVIRLFPRCHTRIYYTVKLCLISRVVESTGCIEGVSFTVSSFSRSTYKYTRGWDLSGCALSRFDYGHGEIVSSRFRRRYREAIESSSFDMLNSDTMYNDRSVYDDRCHILWASCTLFHMRNSVSYFHVNLIETESIQSSRN